MMEKTVDILNRETLFQGYFRLDRFKIKHERFAGGWTRIFTRELFCSHRPCVAVLPYDPQEDKVVLIEQFRVGALANDEDPWMIQLVAGGNEINESIEDSARRETLEEAGCALTDLQPVYECYVSPGCCSERTSLYVGRTSAPENGSIHGVPDEDEDIRVLVLPSTEAINLLYTKKIKCAVTIITLQWFALHRTELRSRWLASNASTPII